MGPLPDWANVLITLAVFAALVGGFAYFLDSVGKGIMAAVRGLRARGRGRNQQTAARDAAARFAAQRAAERRARDAELGEHPAKSPDYAPKPSSYAAATPETD